MMDTDGIEGQFSSTMISLEPIEVGKIILWTSETNSLVIVGLNTSDWCNTFVTIYAPCRNTSQVHQQMEY